VIDEHALPDPEDKLTILEQTIARLTGAGYTFIGMDHFARPEDPLARALDDGSLTRNFQGYSTCGETDLLAFGVSSISHVAGGFAQNVKDPTATRRISRPGACRSSGGSPRPRRTACAAT
jgi:oxygen-independent coproporphyrinogen III oxidase